MLAPYFFYKTRVQISSTDFCTLFFSFAPPRIAQERRLGFKSVFSPVKRLNALRAAYGFLRMFRRSVLSMGSGTMTSLPHRLLLRPTLIWNSSENSFRK